MRRYLKINYHDRAVLGYYGGHLKGLGTNQLFRARGLKGSTPPGPANAGRRLSRAEREKVEADMRERGLL